MRVLFIADVVGKLGRKALKELVPSVKKEMKVDFIIANIENLAHGKGVTEKTFHEILDIGIDVFTSGNHIWRHEEVDALLEDKKNRLIRPANFPPNVPGYGSLVIVVKRQKILVINLIGRVFMKGDYDCPFRAFDALVEQYPKVDHVIVDIHAEASSEKKAIGWYAEGRAALVIGTHTHVPTADAEILGSGRVGYVTDVGMVGAKESILGVGKEEVINGFLTQRPVKHTMVEKGEIVFNSILAEIKNNQCVSIERFDKIINVTSSFQNTKQR